MPYSFKSCMKRKQILFKHGHSSHTCCLRAALLGATLLHTKAALYVVLLKAKMCNMYFYILATTVHIACQLHYQWKCIPGSSTSGIIKFRAYLWLERYQIIFGVEYMGGIRSADLKEKDQNLALVHNFSIKYRGVYCWHNKDLCLFQGCCISFLFYSNCQSLSLNLSKSQYIVKWYSFRMFLMGTLCWRRTKWI